MVLQLFVLCYVMLFSRYSHFIKNGRSILSARKTPMRPPGRVTRACTGACAYARSKNYAGMKFATRNAGAGAVCRLGMDFASASKIRRIVKNPCPEP